MKPQKIQFLDKIGEKRIFSKSECDQFYWYDSKNIIQSYKKDWYIWEIKRWLYFINNFWEGDYKAVSPFFFVDTIWIGNWYVSYWTALEYYGINEQFFNWNIISVYDKFQQSDITMYWYKYKLTMSSLEKDVWITNITRDNKVIRISNIERTILDCFLKPKLCWGLSNIAKAFYEANDENLINYKRLYNYLFEYDSIIRLSKIIGFFIKTFNMKNIPDEFYREVFNIANNSNYIKIDSRIISENALYDHDFKLIVDRNSNYYSLIKY